MHQVCTSCTPCTHYSICALCATSSLPAHLCTSAPPHLRTLCAARLHPQHPLHPMRPTHPPAPGRDRGSRGHHGPLDGRGRQGGFRICTCIHAYMYTCMPSAHPTTLCPCRMTKACMVRYTRYLHAYTHLRVVAANRAHRTTDALRVPCGYLPAHSLHSQSAY